ncbi:DMT family transporter [Bradyrhizobium elkanii]|uniref:DMT family transporter n=1 Tax=Bradyrhizobium elkanii TaxID=29448 RepID=UPI002714E3B9|nr:DMT family transporter [Bradyrhizobium elkanii]WLA93515.1 DMT family transporter [Bradyrhizobium elkanii]
MNRDAELSGMAHVAFASLIFVTMSSAIKVVTQTISPLQVTVLRSVLSIPIIFLTLPKHVRFDSRLLFSKEHFFRSVFGYTGFLAFVACASKLPLTVAASILYTSPIWSLLLSALVLKERQNIATAFGLILGLFGMLAIVQPTISSADTWIVIGLIGAALDSLAVMMIRRIASVDAPEQMALYFMLWSSVIGLPFAIPVWVWPAPADWPLLLLIAGLAALLQIALGRGYALVRLARAAPLDFVRLPASLLVDLVCFGITPTPMMWLGTGLILVGSSACLAERVIRK